MSDADPAPAADTVDAIRGVGGEATVVGCVWARPTPAKKRVGAIHEGRDEIAVGIPAERLDRTPPLTPLGPPGTPKGAAGGFPSCRGSWITSVVRYLD
jgi:hypothetical protein